MRRRRSTEAALPAGELSRAITEPPGRHGARAAGVLEWSFLFSLFGTSWNIFTAIADLPGRRGLHILFALDTSRPAEQSSTAPVLSRIDRGPAFPRHSRGAFAFLLLGLVAAMVRGADFGGRLVYDYNGGSACGQPIEVVPMHTHVERGGGKTARNSRWVCGLAPPG